MAFIARPDYGIGNQMLAHYNQSVVVAFQVSQYMASPLTVPTDATFALESNFIQYFGVIMNGALVPAIVRLQPIVQSAFTHAADVLGHLSHHNHSPCRL